MLNLNSRVRPLPEKTCACCGTTAHTQWHTLLGLEFTCISIPADTVLDSICGKCNAKNESIAKRLVRDIKPGERVESELLKQILIAFEARKSILASMHMYHLSVKQAPNSQQRPTGAADDVATPGEQDAPRPKKRRRKASNASAQPPTASPQPAAPATSPAAPPKPTMSQTPPPPAMPVPSTTAQHSAHFIPSIAAQDAAHSMLPSTSAQNACHSMPPSTSAQHAAHSMPPSTAAQLAAHSMPPSTSAQHAAHSMPPSTAAHLTARSVPPPTAAQHAAHSMPPPTAAQHAADSMPPSAAEQHAARSMPATALAMPPPPSAGAPPPQPMSMRLMPVSVAPTSAAGQAGCYARQPQGSQWGPLPAAIPPPPVQGSVEPARDHASRSARLACLLGLPAVPVQRPVHPRVPTATKCSAGVVPRTPVVVDPTLPNLYKITKSTNNTHMAPAEKLQKMKCQAQELRVLRRSRKEQGERFAKKRAQCDQLQAKVKALEKEVRAFRQGRQQSVTKPEYTLLTSIKAAQERLDDPKQRGVFAKLANLISYGATEADIQALQMVLALVHNTKVKAPRPPPPSPDAPGAGGLAKKARRARSTAAAAAGAASEGAAEGAQGEGGGGGSQALPDPVMALGQDGQPAMLSTAASTEGASGPASQLLSDLGQPLSDLGQLLSDLGQPLTDLGQPPLVPISAPQPRPSAAPSTSDAFGDPPPAASPYPYHLHILEDLASGSDSSRRHAASQPSAAPSTAPPNPTAPSPLAADAAAMQCAPSSEAAASPQMPTALYLSSLAQALRLKAGSSAPASSLAAAPLPRAHVPAPRLLVPSRQM